MDENIIIPKDYKLNKLNSIHDYLWMAGRPNNINPLHKQICMRREILIVEDINLHMVWYDNIIYIKPLQEKIIDEYNDNNFKEDIEFIECINGFLNSYIKLVKTKHDFYIAVEKKLIGETIDWEIWKNFYYNFNKKMDNINLNKRYKYGELRLYRLNWIYRLNMKGLNFFNVYRQYDNYFTKYIQISIILFTYLSIYLTAMQVMLASTESMYYNFALFSIIISTITFFYTFITFMILFFYNLIITLNIKN